MCLSIQKSNNRHIVPVSYALGLGLQLAILYPQEYTGDTDSVEYISQISTTSSIIFKRESCFLQVVLPDRDQHLAPCAGIKTRPPPFRQHRSKGDLSINLLKAQKRLRVDFVFWSRTSTPPLKTTYSRSPGAKMGQYMQNKI